MMEALDYKKMHADLYLPKTAPAVIDVPAMTFIMVDGTGDPNEDGGAYAKALELLYALSYAIKMSHKGSTAIEGYFPYVVPPLEGFWSQKDGAPVDLAHKNDFCWTSAIRQPEFVTPEVFKWACAGVAAKKGLDTASARLETYTEGLCVQCMHLGPYNEEPATLEKLDGFAAGQGLILDFKNRRHHEIYLSDPRRCKPERMRTVLRHPVRRA